MLSRQMDIAKEDTKGSSPLLRLAILESCESVWNDSSIIKRIKIAIKEDETLHPILAFFYKWP